jgi:hypothetical protein
VRLVGSPQLHCLEKDFNRKERRDL